MSTSNPMLYNRYRPKSFKDVRGNEQTSELLKGLVRRGTVHHSIFSGRPGGGKTTSARILAKAVNCLSHEKGEPCNKCKNCVAFDSLSYQDFIEIDGTSYNKVEDVKRLVDLANQYPINPDGKRIILIDEAHQLSRQAFDLLLKFLEEGNTRTLFLFATTDIQLFRPAIISRCYLFNILPLSAKDIAKELKEICEKEGIKYSMEALNKLAYRYQGKTRDAVKTLDLIYKGFGEVTEFDEETPESTLIECIKLAFFNKVDEYSDILETLSITNLAQTLSKALNEVYLYPSISPKLVNESKIDSFKNLIDADNLKKIIKLTVDYKPNDIESFKLYLSIITSLGVSVKYSSNMEQKRGRRFVKDEVKEEPKVIKTDIKTEPTKEKSENGDFHREGWV